jgi:hypothetical protein
MQMTVVAVMCHSLGAFVPEAVGTLTAPVCREEIIVKTDMPMQACMLSRPALADWKERSIYRGDQWRISRVKCVQGDYVAKEHI